MIVSFCFTIKLKNSINSIQRYSELILKAIEYASLHHKVNFYTDAETLSYLDIQGVNIKIIDTSDFYFVDDFKVHLLPIIAEDEVLIDTDVFLFKPLYLKPGFDAYFDNIDNSRKIWYTEHFDWLINNGIRELIPEFNTKVFNIPNIGILKIPNKDLRETYMELYYKIRKWVLSKNPDMPLAISIILGQYLLGMVMSGYNVSYCSNNGNHYAHLSGPNKFKTSGIINFHPSKSSKLL